jgi:hypothetical protein
MGILFVLIFWGVVGSALAIASALCARGVTSWLTRRAANGSQESVRKRAIRNAMLLPFACLVWAGMVFIFQGFINANFLHRDIGLGDSRYCPLPNGYSLLMIDVTEEGTVYNSKTQTTMDGVGDQQDAISGVKELQVAGHYLLGGFDSRYAEHFGDENLPPDSYFLLDTQTGKRSDFTSENELKGEASDLGIKVTMEPIYKIYSRYRFTWFDIVTLCLLVLPPLLAFVLLGRWIVLLRNSRNASESSGGELARIQ